MKVLAIGAHPDDETGFAGGILAKYAAEDHQVYVLLTTRGEGGSMGDPPLCERPALGALREAEARAAVAALGLREVYFLPYQDPEISEDHTLHPIDASLEEFSGAIAEVIAELKPDVILTHGSGGEYGHPQHIYTHQAVFAALEQLRPWRPDEILTWCAAYPNPERERFINADDPADIVLDVSPWLPQKVQAFTAYRTQWPVFFRNNPDASIEDLPLRTESFHRWE
jgi:LmbE family N-acetylglucosaminyl deacetylase